MAEAAFVGLLILFPAAGVLARSWGALLLPALGWPLFYLGLNRGWWGNGTGDGWQYAAVLITAFGVVSTAISVAAARAMRRTPLRQ
jgi:hypothetical protein